MRLSKKEHGWLIEPYTADQSKILDQIMEGYKRLVKDEHEASHSHPLDHNRPRGLKE